MKNGEAWLDQFHASEYNELAILYAIDLIYIQLNSSDWRNRGWFEGKAACELCEFPYSEFHCMRCADDGCNILMNIG